MHSLAAPVLENPVIAQRSSRISPLLLYAMTGFTGLLAEQGFEKYIALLVGATATASAVVVFTYFLGFALGGLIAAHFLERRLIPRPLLGYALIELAVGISCVVFSYAFHPILERLAPLQELTKGDWGRQAIRFGCGCLLVMPIAALMGASFPLIAQVLNNQDALAPRRWYKAYSANLMGAVLAALLAPYLIIPAVGLRGSMWICLAVCAAVCVLVQSQREPVRQSDIRFEISGARTGRLDRDTFLLLGAAFFSGVIFFALEIIWAHLIGVAIGGSVYAFSAMLVSVLAGLLIGSLQVDRVAVIRTSTLLQVCAVALIFQLWVWDLVPILFAIPGPAVYQKFVTREAYRLLITCLLIVPASSTLGLIYPRLLKGVPLETQNASLAGCMSASNSLGCLLGALASTFLLVPVLGSELSLKLMILALSLFALVFRFREKSGAHPRAVAVMALAIIVTVTFVKHWNWAMMTSGVATYFGEVTTAASTAAPLGTPHIVFRDESIQGGFTTVVDRVFTSGKTIRYLYTNGKLQGNDDPADDLRIQFGVAAIPCLFATHFGRALLIGLGTGHTAGVLKELGYKELDIAELSPGIIRAAKKDFGHVNYNVLSDPSVKYTLEDGRNLLLTDSAGKYDLITIELTSIWFAGATNLYSKEFFQLARRRLQPDGVLQQWVQLHRIGPDEVTSAIATARSVFPYVAYWAYGGQGMVVAANHPLSISPERNAYLAARIREARRISPETARSLVEEVSRSELLGQSGVNSMVAALKPVINTDHNRFIEYATPKYSSSQRDWRAYNTTFLRMWNQ